MEHNSTNIDWRARLYISHALTTGEHLELDAGQSHYLRNVLRCSIGEHVELFNGKDGAFDATIDEVTKKTVYVHIGEHTKPAEKLPAIGLAFAPLKRERLDYLVQKAVEMGVTELVPVMTQRTQGGRMNMDKLRANAIEAAEQCERVGLPIIGEPISLGDFLVGLAPTTKLIFCDEAVAGQSAGLANFPKGQSQDLKMVLVGPEGGFTEEERQAIQSHSTCLSMALGPRILRADTAIVAALTLVQYHYGDWVQ